MAYDICDLGGLTADNGRKRRIIKTGLSNRAPGDQALQGVQGYVVGQAARLLKIGDELCLLINSQPHSASRNFMGMPASLALAFASSTETESSAA